MATPLSTAGGDRYVFSDTLDTTGGHHTLTRHLAAIMDPFTTGRLRRCTTSQSRALEIGAGAGTIAAWLADHAAEVVATDLDPTGLPTADNLTAVRHNIATDPVRGKYDVIHSRLVLAHLPNRMQVLDKLVSALTPGGVLMIDEFAAGGWDRCVLDAPDPRAQELFDAYHAALVQLMQDAGTDPGWGRTVAAAMRRTELVDIEVETSARSWHGGEPGCQLPLTMTGHKRQALISAGMDEADLDRFRELLTNPNLMIMNNLMISTVGRRPIDAPITDTTDDMARAAP